MPETPIQTAMRLWAAGQREKARAALQRIVQREPGNAAANQLLATDAYERGEADKALFCIDRAIAAAPKFAEFHVLKGMILNARRDWAGAEESLRRALALEPGHVAAWSCLGSLLADRGRYEDAEVALRKALAAGPVRSATGVAMARVLCDTGRTEEGLELAKRVCGSSPRDERAASFLAFGLNYIDAPAAEVLGAHQRFGSLVRCAPRLRPGEAPNDPDPERSIRVGLVSPDLRTHSVAFFVEPVLTGLDPERFEVFAYSTAADEDATSERLRSLMPQGRWRSRATVGGAGLGAAIRADRIDVLIDLAGHSAGGRLEVFASRPAPVQATWLGYPNTTGLAAMDWRIVDSITDPEGSEALATERSIRIDPCFVCYTPPKEVPPERAARSGPATFGSFNNPMKLSEQTVALWARVLAAAPGSTLVLKGKALWVESVRERIAARFAARGVEGARLELRGHTPGLSDHLGEYAQIDVALDPFPYNGTTTTCDALAMGVPVVALVGDRHAARVGASLLSAAGVPELAARDEEEYIHVATALASDPGRRSAYHASLPGRMRGSPLCDGAAFAARFGGALREMWRAWCAS